MRVINLKRLKPFLIGGIVGIVLLIAIANLVGG